MSDKSLQTPDDLSPMGWLRLDQICQRFEQAWNTGQQPHIQDYLVVAPEEKPFLFQELLAVEVELRWKRGAAIPPEEYLQQFPEYAEQIKGLFGASSRLAGQAGLDATPATPGTLHFPPGPSAPGRFTIVKSHAHGGLGQVSVARDEKLKRQVALKEILPDKRHDHHVRQRFVNEAEITGQLEHPGIVPIYALEEDARGDPYYAMRFIQGRTLAEAITVHHRQPTPLGFRDLLGRFVTVCHTVAYAHSKGVVHRDLKPANVMLGDYGETLVVDWGLAKKLDEAPPMSSTAREGKRAVAETTEAGEITDYNIHAESSTGVGLTQAGQALGTPAYMPPEQAAGELDRLGPASDVYALGAVLYCLLTDRAPYEGASAREVVDRVLHEAPDRPGRVRPGVPPALEAVSLKALAREPRERYASAADLATEVERWQAGEPVSAYQEPLTARLRRWARKRQRLVTGAGVALAVLLVSLLVGAALLGAANRELEEKNTELEQEQDKTKKALAAEKTRRQQARDALDAMTSELLERLLLSKTTLDKEDEAFLKQTLEKYDEFAADTGADKESRVGVANAYIRMASIRQRLGQNELTESAYRQGGKLFGQLAAEFPTVFRYRQEQVSALGGVGYLFMFRNHPKESEEVYAEAIRLQEQLRRDFPHEPEAQQELASLQNNLGFLFHSINRFDRAAAAFREAIRLRRDLVRHYPEREPYRQTLSLSLNNLGSMGLVVGDLKEGEKHLREANRLQERLVKDNPNNPEYRRTLATGLRNLGLILHRQQRWPEARITLEKALKVREELVGEFPLDTAYAIDLGTAYTATAGLIRDAGNPEQSLEVFEKGIKILRAVLRRVGGNMEARQQLCDAHWARAAALDRLGRDRDSEKDWDQAVDLAAGTRQVQVRLDRALSLARAGQVKKAVAAAEQVGNDAKLDRNRLWDKAAVYAVAAARIGTSEAREEYGARAVKLLERARAAGFFDTSETRYFLQYNRVLDGLGHRIDFRALHRRHWEKSVADATKAVEQKPDDAALRMTRARDYAEWATGSKPRTISKSW
jgi:serine/threonine protein kinase